MSACEIVISIKICVLGVCPQFLVQAPFFGGEGGKVPFVLLIRWLGKHLSLGAGSQENQSRDQGVGTFSPTP